MSISRDSCSVTGCVGQGKLNNQGIRKFIRGYCIKHYRLVSQGRDPNEPINSDPRPAIMDRNVAKIPVGVNAKDGYAIVDKNFAWLDKHLWCINGSGYAITRIGGVNTRMHHLILPLSEQNKVVDHINRDPLDNRLSNLRYATHAQNQVNAGLAAHNSTGYKGVSKDKRDTPNCWIAHISIGDKKRHIGVFSTAAEAAKAYDKVARELHGEFAYLNFP